jgi:hypothetical protein
MATCRSGTTVVNVRVAHIRPRHATLAGWVAEPGHVYIGRRGVVFIGGARFPAADSPFCNPYKITKTDTRDSVIDRFKAQAARRMEVDAAYRAAVLGLRGKVLGCWCRPERCHGDAIVELIDEWSARAPAADDTATDGVAPPMKAAAVAASDAPAKSGEALRKRVRDESPASAD